MIFSLLIVHNHVRMSSSTTQILHTTTWAYFTERLPALFIDSPKVVKEDIMTNINDLVQEFLMTSSDGTLGASFFAMRRLLTILQKCFKLLEVCFDIISVFATAVDLADKKLQIFTNSRSPQYLTELPEVLDQISLKAKFKTLVDGYRKMIDRSFFIFKGLGDILRFLPGVVVQKDLSMQGMADLYKIKPDLLECLNKSTIEPLKLSQPSPYPRYVLDDYLFDFLQDPDRSRLYYCDPMLQHISICHHFISFLDRSNAFHHQS